MPHTIPALTPDVRYARSRDGTNVAYFAIGAGPVLIDLVQPPLCNVDLIWRIPEFAEQMRAARAVTYVQIDVRGFGMSDRDVSDLSLASMVLDIEAVADALGAERFALATWGERAMPALACAASHEGRVFAMALREGFGRGKFKPRAEDATMLQLAHDNWELFMRLSADGTQNLLSVAGLRMMHELITRSATQEMYLRYVREWMAWDIFDVLSSVTMPVLVTSDGFTPREECRRLVAALPKGSLVTNSWQRGERSPSADAFNAFLAQAFISNAGGGAPQPAGVDAHDAGAALTPREVEVLRLILAGKSGREIASELVLSARTVERHVANIYRKTKTHGRAQLAAFALRRGLV
jgi:DNA-binding CsgD family transcriptional regulator/pimeloyl-ACP methyl ester carboxylesterase